MPKGHPTNCFYCPHRGMREPGLFATDYFAVCSVTRKRVHFNNTGPEIECIHFTRMPDPELILRIREDNANG